MQFWEAMKYLQEGKKVRKASWDKENYIYLNEMDEEAIVTNEGTRYQFVYTKTIWELYDDRKEVEDENLKRVCNEIMRFIKTTVNHSDRKLKSLCGELYDISITIENLNKDYKLDK